jgi:transaldolase
MNDMRSRIKIFADGAIAQDVDSLIDRYGVRGFTTNPTLMSQAGVKDYMQFARQMVKATRGLPVSFEVFADEFDEMERQALKLAELGENVIVKIPITNTRGEPSTELITVLAEAGVKVNVTAVFTPNQVDNVIPCFKPGAQGIIEILWASCREIYNVAQATQVGCHIITVPYDIVRKLDLLGKDLTEFSLDTVKMFRRDAVASGYTL